MNRIILFLKTFHQFIHNFLQKLEESSLFERWVLRWDNLDPRHQKRFLSYLNIFGYMAVALVFSFPLVSVSFKKYKLSQFEKLQTELKAVAQAPEVVRKPAPAPQGWAAYPISTIDEFQSSFESFLASIGISIDLGEFKKEGSKVTFAFEDITLRQVMALVFQLDGWFPALKFTLLDISNSGSNKVFLKIKGELEYSVSSAQMFQIGGSVTDSPMGGRRNFPNGDSPSGANSFFPKTADSPQGASARNTFDERPSSGDGPPPGFYDEDPGFIPPSPPGMDGIPPPPITPFEDD